MDPEDEKELMEAIGALTHEKTILLIARRLKTVWHADRDLGGRMRDASSSGAPMGN